VPSNRVEPSPCPFQAFLGRTNRDMIVPNPLRPMEAIPLCPITGFPLSAAFSPSAAGGLSACGVPLLGLRLNGSLEQSSISGYGCRPVGWLFSSRCSPGTRTFISIYTGKANPTGYWPRSALRGRNSVASPNWSNRETAVKAGWRVICRMQPMSALIRFFPRGRGNRCSERNDRRACRFSFRAIWRRLRVSCHRTRHRSIGVRAWPGAMHETRRTNLYRRPGLGFRDNRHSEFRVQRAPSSPELVERDFFAYSGRWKRDDELAAFHLTSPCG